MKPFFGKIILLTIFIFFSCTIFGQGNKSHILKSREKRIADSTEYLTKSVDFIYQVIGEKINFPNFILVNRIDDGRSVGCTLSISDTLNFSKSELEFFKKKKYPKVDSWTKANFQNATLISQDSLNSIFNDGSKGWNYFHKNIGKCYNTFSMPVFFRNYTYCFFYTSNSSCERCGEGKLALYIKNSKGKWLEMATYCNWVN